MKQGTADTDKAVRERADILRTFDFFADCPDDFFLALAGITEHRSVIEGTPILTEGQLNDYLYFLLDGEVEILVRDERVAVLSHPGDLIGEMSVITSRPTSATIVPLTTVTFFAIDSRGLESLIRSSHEFAHCLYRTYARSLSKKMLITNDKARRFEMANRALVAAIQALEDANSELDRKVQERTQDLRMKTDELERSYQALETRSAELETSHRKLEELYFSKDVTFKRLNELHDDHLGPLHGVLAQLESSVPATDRVQIQRARAQVQASLETLEPLTSLYTTEQQMKSRRVLLAESDRKQQVVARLALGGTGVSLDIAANAEEAQSRLESGYKYDLIFASPELADLGPEAKRLQPQAKLVFMGSADIPSYLPILRRHPVFTNIVSRDTEDRTFTVKNIMTTVSKLTSRDLFGLEKYLIWGVEVQSRLVEGSNGRAALIEAMGEQFSRLGVRGRIVDRAATVAEELLMNAVYDAPIGADGKPLYNHLPRTQAVDLAEKERGEFRFACDGMLAAISVSDPFGGFGVEILLDYLERNYVGGTSPQISGKGGAGRGLHQIIENSDLVVFNVKRNIRTEVIALFNLDPAASDRDSKPSFHFFID